MMRGKMLVGIVLIAVGTILLLDAYELVEAADVLATWWPTVFIAAGGLAMAGRPPALVAGGIVALFGLVGLGRTTGVLGDLSWGVIWALVLVAGGLWFIFGRGGGGGHQATDEELDITCVFSGREVTSVARPFRGGSLTGIFGGVKLDLTEAALEDGALLDAVGIFGGIDITVPPGWAVRINGPAIFGGIENKADTQPSSDDAPTLNIRAFALFGAVEVKLGVPRHGRVST